MAGTASWWSAAGCPGTAAGTSSEPVDGTCFPISSLGGIQSASIACSNGQFVGSVYSTSTCSAGGLVGTGTGTGDGNTCVAISSGLTTVGSTKINCNGADKIVLSGVSLTVLVVFTVLVLLSM